MDKYEFDHMHDNMSTVDGVHYIQEISPSTWRIDEGMFVNCYLLAGQERALLIDTGLGFGNLVETVRSLTNLPVDVVLTHRHCDHSGGVGWFDEYHVHAADKRPVYALLGSRLASNVLLLMWKSMMRKMSEQGEELPKDAFDSVPTFEAPTGHARMVTMDSNTVFHLGGRDVTVETVPGHTRGSVVLLDDSRGLMFTGDDANPQIWMHLPGCTTLEEWYPGCERIARLAENHDVWAGHGDGHLSSHQIQDLLACARKLMAEKANTALPHTDCYPSMQDTVNITYNTAHVHSRHHV